MGNEDSSGYSEREMGIFLNVDSQIRKQQAMDKYRQLKKLNPLHLSLDDELFIENFETAMHLLWGIRFIEDEPL